MSFHDYFILAAAFLTFIIAPIWLLWSFIHGLRTKASERKGGGGGMSNAVAGAMMELDRILTRPSVEHTFETEKPTLAREDDDDGE